MPRGAMRFVSEEGPVVTVRAIAGGGDGVATLPDGRTVFVPRAAPGDQVRLRGLRLHARFARAVMGDLLEPGPDRVMPPCPHYVADSCGGCQLMHLTPGAQRAAKARIAGDALRRIGHLAAADPEVVPAPSQLGYRTKITLTMQRGRLGYHPVNEPARVFEVVACLLATPEVRALHAAVRAARAHLPQDEARIVLRVDREGGRHVIVLTAPGAWTGGKALHAALASAGVPAVIWWHPEGGKPRAIAGAGNPWPATVFEQVHPAMGDAVRVAAIDALGDVRGVTVWDLYAGIGESTAELARRGADLDSVERDPRAVELADQLGPAGPRRHAGLVETAIRTLPPAIKVLTNPPRTGMDRSVAKWLGDSSVARVAYVSCDPATLARDIHWMGDRFALESVQAFDQFPETAHLECVAVLGRQ